MSMRRIARRAYGQFFTALSWLITGGRVRRFVAADLRARANAPTTLRIVAPGGSVADHRVTPKQMADCDVLGVNYFSLCREVELWNAVTYFVIEPHPGYRTYASSIAEAVAMRGPVTVILKGLGSPSKIRTSLRLVRELVGVPGADVVLAQERYITDLRAPSYADAIMAYPDDTVSGLKTIMWSLSFAVAGGYRRIILHGFDFSQDYVYGATSETGHANPPVNTWVHDPGNRSAVLGEVERMRDLLAARGVTLAQAGCRGPLQQILPSETS